MILLIDNYDSFTWNLVQRIGELDPTLDLRVVRNDEITPDEAEALSPSHVIVSPGPCTPAEAGVSNDIITRFAGRVPLLGVCLGHQCIGHVNGLRVVRHGRIMHGKTSDIRHDGGGVFEGLDPAEPITVTRYHSLVVLTEPDGGLPSTWQLSAWIDEEVEDKDGAVRTERVIMGLRQPATDTSAVIEGVQFHPESFLTLTGPVMLANFLGLPRPEPLAAPA
ncbi:MAG: aminodeoxychorismate/anthranilate synthase component II [Planctomycetota bacterium]